MMFSHDGIMDSLTRLAAPPLFYEELHRELSRYERSGDPFSIIRLVLPSKANSHGTQRSSDVSTYEMEILNFSETLTRLSRREDMCARIGEREFAILLRGPERVAMNFIERVNSKWIVAIEASLADGGTAYLDFLSAHVVSQAGESALELLNRLDCQPLVAYLVRFRTDDRTSRH